MILPESHTRVDLTWKTINSKRKTSPYVSGLVSICLSVWHLLLIYYLQRNWELHVVTLHMSISSCYSSPGHKVNMDTHQCHIIHLSALQYNSHDLGLSLILFFHVRNRSSILLESGNHIDECESIPLSRRILIYILKRIRSCSAIDFMPFTDPMKQLLLGFGFFWTCCSQSRSVT